MNSFIKKMYAFMQRDIGEIVPFIRFTTKIPLRELTVFCRKLSFLLDAGIPVKTSLSIVAEQSASKTLKRKFNDVLVYVMRGETLSHALSEARIFPTFLCGLVSVGEISANLPRVMTELAEYYEQQAKSENELRAALAYPIVVTGLMLLVMVMAVIYVLPNYGTVFAASDMPLPPITQALLSFSAFTLQYPYIPLTIIISIIAFLFIIYKNEAAGRLKLRFPLYKELINLRFTQAMSLLLLSGQPLTEAVLACSQVLGNEKTRRDMLDVAAGLNEGRAFWETINRLFYMDALLVGMIRVGEETGRLTQTMQKCKDYYTQEFQHSVNKMGKFIGPLITIFLGLVLGVLMLAIILPTFSLIDIT
jgi:type IV pilus assembly protein PilC